MSDLRDRIRPDPGKLNRSRFLLHLEPEPRTLPPGFLSARCRLQAAQERKKGSCLPLEPAPIIAEDRQSGKAEAVWEDVAGDLA